MFISNFDTTLLGITTFFALSASTASAAWLKMPTNPLTAAKVLLSELSQAETNGLGLHGTFKASKLPNFLSNNPLPHGFPWGDRTAHQHNPYTSTPNTGVTRYYEFNVTRGQLAPDGYLKDMILINGQFPGPTIEANWGDMIEVTVHNSITGPEDGTSFHWHGLLQKSSPWEDGVPGIQQCPIAPGTSLTYTFKADLYGTSWYHSHYSAQSAAGVFGPMIVYGPAHVDYDIDLGPVFLTDWNHRDYEDILEDVMGTDMTKITPKSDNNLINGKMNFDCSTLSASNDTTKCTSNAGISKFTFTPGKTHRLRLINAGGEGIQRFSIDGHSLTVIANDFVPIKPYKTNVVTLGVGQRTDVLVTAFAKTANSAYWMRSNISTLCSSSNQPEALAAVYYETVHDKTLAPNSTPWPYTEVDCANDDLSKTVPWYPIQANTKPATTYTINIGAEVNATGHFVWTLNGQTFRADYDNPVFLQAAGGNLTFNPESNVFNFGDSSSVRIILNNTLAVSHPMHLHGHNMQVLASGTGNWDGQITNPTNPLRRDTQLLLPNGYFVFQYDTDNPGVWPLHCHIAWHVSSGLYASMLEQPSKIAQYNVPREVPATCKNWKAWGASHVVDQIDSGL